MRHPFADISSRAVCATISLSICFAPTQGFAQAADAVPAAIANTEMPKVSDEYPVSEVESVETVSDASEDLTEVDAASDPAEVASAPEVPVMLEATTRTTEVAPPTKLAKASGSSSGGSTVLLALGALAAVGGGVALAAGGGGGSGGGGSTANPANDAGSDQNESVSNSASDNNDEGSVGTTIICSQAISLAESSDCTSGDLTYDDTVAESIRSSNEFQFSNSSTARQAAGVISPAERIKAHVAYGYGLSGDGVTIGIFDTGFRTTHQDLTGQINYLSGTEENVDTGSSFHGTHVAGLAAARRGGGSALGIAYDANILASTIVFNDGLTAYAKDFSAMAEAGATVSSNSYGFISSSLASTSAGSEYYNTRGEIQYDHFDQYMRDNNISDAATALEDLFTGSAADWRNTVDAFRTFQTANNNRGVIVWANSNYGPFANVGRASWAQEAGLTDVDSTAAFPLMFPELEGQWITVSDVTSQELASIVLGADVVEQSPSSSKAGGNFLLSAPCGAAAEFCLSMDGVEVRSTSSNSDTEYATLTGTSMATPQVAGAVAIVQQAFPELNGTDIVSRLLATADNSWFTADGTTDFGNAIEHDYSRVWGHGFIDLQRALQPIGITSVASLDGRSLTLDGSQIELSTAFGADAAKRLTEAKFAMNDALGAQFSNSLGSFVVMPDEDFGDALLAEWSPRRDEQTARIGANTQLGFSQTSDFTDRMNDTSESEWRLSFAPEQGVGMEVGYGGSLNQALGFSTSTGTSSPVQIGRAFDIPFLSLRDGESYWSSLSPSVESGLSFGSFVQHDDKYQSFGALLEQRVELGHSINAIATAGALFEDGGLMGAELSGVFANDSSTSVFGRLGFQASVTNDIVARATANVAFTQGSAGGGLVNEVSGLVSDSFALAVEKRGVLSDLDSVTLGLSQPLRVSSGALSTMLPVGYSTDGATQFESSDIDLSASARELRLSAAYSAEIDSNAHLTLGVAAIRDAGHVERDDLGYAGYVGVSLNF